MKQITLSTTDFTAKDKFNIKAGAKALKDAIGQKLVVTKACIGISHQTFYGHQSSFHLR